MVNGDGNKYENVRPYKKNTVGGDVSRLQRSQSMPSRCIAFDVTYYALAILDVVIKDGGRVSNT